MKRKINRLSIEVKNNKIENEKFWIINENQIFFIENISYFHLSSDSLLLGSLILTNYRLIFLPKHKANKLHFISIPLGQIQKIKKIEKQFNNGLNAFGFSIYQKTFRKFKFFIFEKDEKFSFLFDSIIKNSFINEITLSFAFQHKNIFDQSLIDFGWSIYKINEEFERQNFSDMNWIIIDWNNNFNLSPTYPNILAIPKDITKQELEMIAKFRTKKRFPVLTWKHPKKLVCITRSSQPKKGVFSNRSQIDEKYISIIQKMSSNKPFDIFDCRPKINAIGNKTKGGGYENISNYPECSLTFLGIENIHHMRNSYELLRKLCRKTVNKKQDDQKWFEFLAQTKWLFHIQKLLQSSIKVVESIQKNCSVLVHCSDGWDRSVSHDSPILCRFSKKFIGIFRIDQLRNFDLLWKKDKFIKNKESCFVNENIEVWTELGFTKINQIIRHKTKEDLVRIQTKSGSVDVTTGHSLLDPSGNCFKAEKAQIGDKLLQSEIDLNIFPKIHLNIQKEEELDLQNTLQTQNKFNEMKITNNLIWFFGLFTVNGNVNSSSHLWNLHHNSLKVLFIAKLIIEKLLNSFNSQISISIIKNQIQINYEKSKSKDVIDEFIQFFDDNFFDKDHNRKIPNLIFNLDLNLIESFWNGFLIGEFNQTKRNFKLENMILNSSSKIFIAGLYLLIKLLFKKNCFVNFNEEMNVFEIFCEESKRNFNSLNFENNCIIKKSKIDKDETNYVYDLSTENEHFQAGIGTIIVHNTSQVCSLAEVILDPFYRTIKGFSILIEKDWISFGHKFTERCGHCDSMNTFNKQNSPIFIQWIDCVFQCVSQFPNAFEFNSFFLLSILEHLNSRRFGTFLCDNDFERFEKKLQYRTYSLWTLLNSNQEYLNPSYKKYDGILGIQTYMGLLKFWDSFYLQELFPSIIINENSFNLETNLGDVEWEEILKK
ncbi:intein-containing myotubularin-related precursor [Anaeramoeba ignava]|uniref:Intein-containing myotubularin-related n=1 Tax=Anaeramoeba ignava TaxID=1746090 RepID=A0A9Q0RCY0_ANAIG|nr:intein-containing myotubularin-related precursor [Anaeramoeba ignava]